MGISVFSQVPDIVKVDKIHGTYSELVTITGSGFSNDSNDLRVHFGAAMGKIIFSSEYIIEVEAPGGATFDNISVTNLVSKATGYANNYFDLAFNGKIFDEAKIMESLRITEDAGLFDLYSCDFNGDGLNDVVTTNNTDAAGSNSITVYQNITEETENDIKFKKINSLNLNTGKGARNISCADLDGDGKPDLVVGKGGGSADRIYIFKNISNTANIQFEPFITLLLSENVSSSTTRRLKIQDLDKDGKPDIIMTDQGVGKVFIFGNKSINGSMDFPSSARQTIETTAGSLVGLDVSDLNNDQKPEIVCNSDVDKILIFPNRSIPGTIKMGMPDVQTISGATLVNLKIGDLDNDGDKEIVVTNLVNNIFILVNNGNNDAYNYGTPKYVETGRAPWGLDFGDLNGDGLVDITVATTDASEKLTVLLNTTSGSGLTYIPYYVGNADISFNVNISDFNGDAKPDVGYVNRQDNTLVFLKNTHCVISEIMPQNPSNICSTQPVNLTTTPALKVDYVWRNTITNLTIPGDYSTDISLVGSYQATITSSLDGCNSQSTIIPITDGGNSLPPVVSVTNPGVVCEGNNFKLVAQSVSGVTYTWTTPNETTVTGRELSITNAQLEDGGRYSLVLESGSCKTDPILELVEISYIPPMEISASAGEQYCSGTTNELSVPFVTGAQYEWKINNSIIPGEISNTYTTNQSGTYVVSARNGHSCTAISNSISIKEVDQPVASFKDIASSCLNELIQFENTSTYDNSEPPVFVWDFGDGNSSTDKNPSHSYSSSGEYNVTLQVGYNNTTCSDNYEKSIKVAESVAIEIKADDTSLPDGIFNLCDGNTAELSVVATPGQVTWNTGETTSKITISEPGTYSVTSGGNTGCSNSDEIQVNLVDDVKLEITSGSQRIESGSVAQLGARGADYYSWEPAEDLDDPNIPNPLASPLVTTDYTVTGTNNFGCSDSGIAKVFVDEMVVISVDAPKAFTPNGDGINDEWKIGNIAVYASCPIRIFNRKGQNVYEASEYNNDWDGTYSGKELPEGAYYYIISCEGSEVHTGSIALIR